MSQSVRDLVAESLYSKQFLVLFHNHLPTIIWQRATKGYKQIGTYGAVDQPDFSHQYDFSKWVTHQHAPIESLWSIRHKYLPIHAKLKADRRFVEFTKEEFWKQKFAKKFFLELL